MGGKSGQLGRRGWGLDRDNAPQGCTRIRIGDLSVKADPNPAPRLASEY